jgi:hypothetical protein
MKIKIIALIVRGSFIITTGIRSSTECFKIPVAIITFIITIIIIIIVGVSGNSNSSSSSIYSKFLRLILMTDYNYNIIII